MDLPGLVEAAAGGESIPARRARRRLARLRLEQPGLLPSLLHILVERASPAALEAAGGWLFFPDSERELELLLQLTARAGELLEAASRRPGPWWNEGLAQVLALAGGEPRRRLLALARREPWARQVVAHLPPDLGLAGGYTPESWLARQGLGPAACRRLRNLIRGGDWPALAGLGRGELVLARHWCGLGPAQGRALAWPAGGRALLVLEALARLTAREGRRAFLLAGRACRSLGRPVILAGNASLGGPPLWAVPGPWQEGGGRFGGGTCPDRGRVQGLARLRARRLVGASLWRALWEMATAVAVAGRGGRVWRGLLEQSRPWLSSGQAASLEGGEAPLELGSRPLALARRRVEQEIARARFLEEQGRGAVEMLYGLVAGGVGVFPWLDKFVASTAHAGDHGYLAGLVELFSGLDPRPLWLLVDETPHPRSPSLAAALLAGSGGGVVLRGLGGFGGGMPEPGDLEGALLEAAVGADLVAFRPLPGAEKAPALWEVLAGRGRVEELAPVSRDCAPWLLQGTAAARLVDPFEPRGGMEPPGWLLCSGGFAALGEYLRGRVVALAGRREPPAGFWAKYQRLCGL